MGTIRIGISGWRYEGWRGVFYPEGLAHRRELEYASRRFPTIEINGTFYSLQRPEHFQDASRDVYCYFDNDAKVKAPFDAQRLMARLGLDAPAGPRCASRPTGERPAAPR